MVEILPHERRSWNWNKEIIENSKGTVSWLLHTYLSPCAALDLRYRRKQVWVFFFFFATKKESYVTLSSISVVRLSTIRGGSKNSKANKKKENHNTTSEVSNFADHANSFSMGLLKPWPIYVVQIGNRSYITVTSEQYFYLRQAHL